MRPALAAKFLLGLARITWEGRLPAGCLGELCHALVEGPARLRLVDYGLDNTSDQHRVNEDAAMRLQAALAGEHGLRGVLAVTTEWRPYYDALPADPLAEAGVHGRQTGEHRIEHLGRIRAGCAVVRRLVRAVGPE
jgi:hypothetical protein